MPLRPVTELLGNALNQGYALGYFESWNFESLQGVLDAAESTRSPVIIGFNGEFLTQPGRLARERIELYGALGRAAAESASVPCGLIFNECSRDQHLRQAVEAGFNLVMLADAEAPFEDYARRVGDLVAYAHARGVGVEAEIGELPTGFTGQVVHERSSLTDPELAARFAAKTGIDLLSVSVGNVHVMIGGVQVLNLDRLALIRKKVGVPLGLHGGSGIPTESLKEAIRMGVVKVAYGTYLKQRYLAALRQSARNPAINPHVLLGMGGPEDMLVSGRMAVRDAILERIEDLGCCGRA